MGSIFLLVWCGENRRFWLVDGNRAGGFRRCRTDFVFGAHIAPLAALGLDAVHPENSRPFVIGDRVHGVSVSRCQQDVHDFLQNSERLLGVFSCRNLPIVNPRFSNQRGDFFRIFEVRVFAVFFPKRFIRDDDGYQ